MTLYRIRYILFNLKSRVYLSEKNKQKYNINKNNQIIKRKIHSLLPNGSNDPDPNILFIIMSALSYFCFIEWFYGKKK